MSDTRKKNIFSLMFLKKVLFSEISYFLVFSSLMDIVTKVNLSYIVMTHFMNKKISKIKAKILLSISLSKNNNNN